VLAPGRGLSAIAPTVLQLMGLEPPAAMSGQSLLVYPLENRPIPAVEGIAPRANAA